ncbi:MAG TPA: ABC transporter substrate-binding protein [Candidatus Binataceae bacterium]|nr:ABC transporter substrate-binding protein [Candidatus Binataceae bacterium]
MIPAISFIFRPQTMTDPLNASVPHSRVIRSVWAFTLVSALTLAMLCSRPAPAAAQGAMSATQDLVNRALEILRNKQVPVAQRRRQLKQLIEPRFDFTEMSRSAIGYHWRTLTPAQRSDFTQVFTAFIEAAYLDKVQDYSGQQVQFGQERSLGQGYAEVDTRIIQNGKSPLHVNYLLAQRGADWKVYDVTVEAISIIANYRNQFNRVINQQGFPKLMSDLRAKQQQLGAELGE